MWFNLKKIEWMNTLHTHVDIHSIHFISCVCGLYIQIDKQSEKWYDNLRLEKTEMYFLINNEYYHQIKGNPE